MKRTINATLIFFVKYESNVAFLVRFTGFITENGQIIIKHERKK